VAPLLTDLTNLAAHRLILSAPPRAGLRFPALLSPPILVFAKNPRAPIYHSDLKAATWGNYPQLTALYKFALRLSYKLK